MKLILVGGLEGKTVNLRGIQFVNGEAEVPNISAESHGGFLRYMARSYQAYPDYDAVKMLKTKHKNGTGKTDSNSGQGSPEPVSGDVQSDGGESPQTAPDDSPEPAGDSTGKTGSVPQGDGHADSGVSEEDEVGENIHKAIEALDHDNDDHWTNSGKPAVDAVSKLAGMPVTRAQIDNYAPDAARNE